MTTMKNWLTIKIDQIHSRTAVWAEHIINIKYQIVKSKYLFYYFFMASINPQSDTQATAFVKAEEFRKYIETEVLKIIKDLAEKNATPKERIQEIAKHTLTLIRSGMTIEELYRNAVKLDDNFSELAPIVSLIMKAYEEKYEKKAIEEVSLLIKSGKYAEAQGMVKKVLAFKMN